MRWTRSLSGLLAILLVGPLVAGEPASVPLESLIDGAIGAKLQESGAAASAVADDATLVCRLSLDLAGRIPSVEEARGFVESSARTSGRRWSIGCWPALTLPCTSVTSSTRCLCRASGATRTGGITCSKRSRAICPGTGCSAS